MIDELSMADVVDDLMGRTWDGEGRATLPVLDGMTQDIARREKFFMGICQGLAMQVDLCD